MSVQATSPAAGASATPTTASPSAVARVSPDAKSSDGTLSTREAANFLKERRAAREKLRLVPDEPEAEEPTQVAEQADGAVEDAAEAEAPDADVDGKPEVEPTWAQKLRTDLTKKTERVAELEKQHAAREAKFADAHRAVTHKIEDLSADVKAEQAYSAMLEQAIADAGLVVPSDWKRAVLAERRAQALERQLARGQSVQRSAGHEKSAEAAKAQIQDLAKQIPEIAAGLAGKDAEVQVWLRKRFAVDESGKPVGPGMKGLSEDAQTFIKALRWDRHSKTEAAKKRGTPPPSEAQRPKSTTLNGSAGTAGAKRVPMVPKNEKEAQQWLASRRAARR